MKPFLLFLFFLTSIHPWSQPRLEPVYQLPDPPELTVNQLIQYEDIISFKHNEGMVIYNRQEDQWKLYEFLDQYERLGHIINIQKLNHDYVVSLEKGGVIISGSTIKVFNSSIISSFQIKDKILVLSSEFNDEESGGNYFNAFDYYEADYLFFYDPEKDETDTIKLSRSIYSVKFCELFKDMLWIYSLDEESEDWFPEFLKVDLKGNVTHIGAPDSNYSLVHSLKAYKNDLFILTDSSLFSLLENESLKKIMDVDPVRWYSVIRDYETGIYIFPAPGEAYHDSLNISKIDLKSKTRQVISMPGSISSWETYYTDYLIFNNKLYNYSDDLQLINGQNISEPLKSKVYTIREGLTDRIDNLAEDDKETWFINTFSGIHRFIKADSAWISYTQFINFQNDSLGKLGCDVLTLNKDFVFIPLMNDKRGIAKYLLFDRKSEKFIVLSKEEFIRKFLFNGERFISYTGENLTEANPPNILNQIVDYGEVWNLFLFLYKLPISGNFSYDYGNYIISNDRCTILSFFVMPPKFWYDGILIKLKDDSTLYFMVAQKPIRDFESSIHPYIIGGDAYRVFAASRGNFAHGVLIYDLPTNSCKTDRNLYGTLEDFSFLQGTGRYVMIGGYGYGPWPKLYALDVLTFELTELSKFITGTARNCKSTESYIYVATDEGLVYFDHDLNFKDKLCAGQTMLSRTKLNLYLISENKVYLIKEDND